MSKNVCIEFLKKGKPFFAIIFLQFVLAGMTVLSKAAMNQGMSTYVFVVYCHAAATIVMTPFAFVFDKKIRSKMTRPVFIKLLFLALLGVVTDHNLMYLGMKYTSATFTTAIYNILPAITFVMACILRLEKVKLKSIRSQAKIVGTVASVGGAMLMTLVKGPVIELFWTKGRTHQEEGSTAVDLQHYLKGSLMLILACFTWSAFTILQVITSESYPAQLSMTSWICFLGSIEGAIFALIMERGNPTVWAIQWNTTLLATIYSGVLCAGVAYYIQGVIMKERGPVFVSSFGPLCTIIVAAMGSIILAEQMYLGTVTGAIIIFAGLYLVMWGKIKDYEVQSLSIKEELPLGKHIPHKESDEKSVHEVIIIKASDGVSNDQNQPTTLS